MVLYQLADMCTQLKNNSKTDTYTYIHEIAEKLKRRSLVFLFTDMFQDDRAQEEMFEALRHLKHNKHDVVLFHAFDGSTELDFNFDNKPTKFTDVETGEFINLYADNVRETYKEAVSSYFDRLKKMCGQYRIKYVPMDIKKDFEVVLTTFLLERQLFK
jgi:hypothetical protein